MSLIAIVLIYAAFDLLNKRNVPDVFAYASVVLGIAVTFLYNSNILPVSFGIAAAVAIIGYIVYRAGLWGAGDYFELVAISLIFPIQPYAWLSNVTQLGLPFVLSVFVATGFAAVWTVPIYYLFFTKRQRTEIRPDVKHIGYGVALLILYMMLLIGVFFQYSFGMGRFILILLISIPSFVTLVFSEEITSRMVQRIYPNQLDEGDIIAFNMMSRGEKKYFSSKYSGFGRLATKYLITKMKKERAKLPVYRDAAPLAVFIAIGAAISLLFGNIILFII